MLNSFASRGFSNWKDGTIGIKKHECSDCHSEAVEAVITFPSQLPIMLLRHSLKPCLLEGKKKQSCIIKYHACSEISC